MLHQAYQVFQVEVGLSGNIFSQSFISFGRLPTRGFFCNLWELLHRYGVVFHLHSDFDIPLLREQDRTLTDAVHNTGILIGGNRRPSIDTGTLKGCTASGIWYAAIVIPSIRPCSLKRCDRALETFPEVPTGPDHRLWLKMIHSLTQVGHRLLHSLGRYIGAPHRPIVWFLSETLGSLFLKLDLGGHDVYTLNQTPCSTRYGTTYTYSHHNTGPCLESHA
jgi:hypothetical protein